MSITPIGQDATWSIGQQTVQRHHPSFTNTASLLGLSSTDLTSQLQSGTTLADLAKQKGVSSSDLLASVEKDLQANAPQGAQAPSDSQLQQFATNIINGTRPSEAGNRAHSNLTKTWQEIAILTQQPQLARERARHESKRAAAGALLRPGREPAARQQHHRLRLLARRLDQRRGRRRRVRLSSSTARQARWGHSRSVNAAVVMLPSRERGTFAKAGVHRRRHRPRPANQRTKIAV